MLSGKCKLMGGGSATAEDMDSVKTKVIQDCR
jgi:hypothetical protein